MVEVGLFTCSFSAGGFPLSTGFFKGDMLLVSFCVISTTMCPVGSVMISGTF